MTAVKRKDIIEKWKTNLNTHLVKCQFTDITLDIHTLANGLFILSSFCGEVNIKCTECE